MEKQKYIDDLSDIKAIMNRSTRFLSLSGYSGIAAGIIALLGAWAASVTIGYDLAFDGFRDLTVTQDDNVKLLLIASCTLCSALVFGIFFTYREAKKENQKMWDKQALKFYFALAIPLVTGGLLCLLFWSRGYIGIIAPLTLIFYGLSLVNASNFTMTEVRSLGLLEILLGLLSAYFIGYGLIFWIVGFGVLHIVYGVTMQLKK